MNGLRSVVVIAFAFGCTKHNPESCCSTALQCESYGLENITPCAGINVCDTDGACEPPQCSTSTDCTSPEAPVCVDQLCVASCSTDADCSGNANDMHCSPAGACVECNSSTDCSGGLPVCDTETNTCVDAGSGSGSGSGSNLDCTPELLYSRSAGFLSQSVVYRMRLDDFVEHTVSDGTDSDDFAVWSPDGKTIALSRNLGTLWTVDENGSSPHQVDSAGSSGGIFYPIWSPDGMRLLYDAASGSTTEIRSAIATGSSATSITPGVDAEGPLEWSPDGAHVLFESNRTGNYDVFKMDPTGDNQTNLTNQTGDDGKDGAHWSPDSSHVVFTGSNHIWTVASDGTGGLNLTGTASVTGTPSWASTGTIYYASGTNEPTQLFEMNSNGTNQHSVEDNTATDIEPILSPAGSKLGWLSDRQTANGQTEVWIAGADGSNPARATNGTVSVQRFTWRPCHAP